MAADPLRLGREAFRRQEWADAHALLADADRRAPLEPDDLELLANSAYLIGNDDEGAGLLARGYRGRLALGDLPGAARSAIWLALHFVLAHEETLGNAWLMRARRALPADVDCVEQGLLLVLAGLESAARGDAEAAAARFGSALEIGDRFAHQDLSALARTGLSESLIASGETRQAMPLLDEVMVSIAASEVSPVTAGIVYCAVIEACMDAYDLPRAQAWTAAFTRWCGASRIWCRIKATARSTGHGLCNFKANGPALSMLHKTPIVGCSDTLLSQPLVLRCTSWQSSTACVASLPKPGTHTGRPAAG